MIKLDNIKKVFQTEDVETWALRNISLEVKEGEFVAIMGPSGCGKSTLLNIIGLLNNPSGGSYLLDDRDVSTLKESERTLIRRGMIGFVFQSFNLIDELNVAEEYRVAAPLYGRVEQGTSQAFWGRDGARGHVPSCQALSFAAFGWSAATHSHCTSHTSSPQTRFSR